MAWPGHAFALKFFGAVLAGFFVIMAVLIHLSALPAEASGKMITIFNPGTTEQQALAQIVAAQGNIVKTTGLAFVWVVTGDEPGLAGRLRKNGALGAYRELPINIEMAGCIAVVEAKVSAMYQ